MSVSAIITNIARCSIHDGPGVRTVVYFKGCALRCKWCHNPETFSQQKQILFAPSKCVHCGRCIEVCPKHHTAQGNELLFFREGCIACGKCANSCPSLALSLCGEEKDVFSLFEEIQKDAHYYASSKGGVTFSGGECLIHSQFVKEIATLCKENHIHTVVETALFIPWKNIEEVLPYIDLFFADLKIPDPAKHREFTGQDNQRIIDNITRLSNRHDNIILRIPVIPRVNDTDDDIEGFARIIRGLGKGVKEIELLRYNHLAESKYTLMGSEYKKFADTPQTNEEMQRLCSMLQKKSNLHCYFV